jgi:hypothetical protein
MSYAGHIFETILVNTKVDFSLVRYTVLRRSQIRSNFIVDPVLVNWTIKNSLAKLSKKISFEYFLFFAAQMILGLFLSKTLFNLFLSSKWSKIKSPYFIAAGLVFSESYRVAFWMADKCHSWKHYVKELTV